VLGGRHDHAAGLRRRDARWVEPYGGPTEHGTWTLDLHSVRPFHPQRLLENIEALGGGRLRGRGRFWVPDRPDSICQWDGAGGQVSIGAVWRTGRELPTTHLVVTGQDPADLPRVRDAFARCLLTVAEWAEGLTPWLGAEDPLAPWLGDRDAKV
jgi:G3E family GTPase